MSESAAPIRRAWAASPPSVQRLAVISTVVLVGFLASVAYHYITGVYLRMRYPYTTFLFYPPDRFMDWYNDLGFARAYMTGSKLVRAGDPAAGTITYTTFSHLVMTLFQFLPKHVSLGFVATFFLGVLAVGARYLMRGMDLTVASKVRTGVILIALSYPVLFELDRMNQEAMVFLYLAGFVWLYCLEKRRSGLVFLALAIAAKLFPAVLLLVPLADRRYKDTALTVAGASAVLVLSTVIVGSMSTYGIAGTFVNGYRSLFEFHGSYLHTFELVHYNHALWGVWTLFGIQSGMTADAIRAATLPYTIAMVLLGLGISAYIFFVEKEMWRKVALCVLMMLTFVFTSHDYTLIHMFLVVFLFVATAVPRRSDIGFGILIALLLVPLDYGAIVSDVKVSVILYPLVSLVLMGSIVAGGLVGRFSKTARLEATRRAEAA